MPTHPNRPSTPGGAPLGKPKKEKRLPPRSSQIPNGWRERQAEPASVPRTSSGSPSPGVEIIRHLIVLLAILSLGACRGAAPVSPDPQETRAPQTHAATATAPRQPVQTSPQPLRTPTRPESKAETGSTGVAFDRALRPTFRCDAEELTNAPRYAIDLTLDVDQATLVGHQHTSYTNTESVPLETLYVRLFPNTPGYGGTMSVRSLKLDGQTLEYEEALEGSALRLSLPAPLTPGDGVELTLSFTLELPTEGHPADSRRPYEGYRQLGIYDGVAALSNTYALIPVYDHEGWNVELAPPYGDAVFSDVAFFHVTIAAPETMTLAASGDCLRTETDVGMTTWSCVAAPMRDFVALVGEDYRLESQDVGGTTVNSVFYSGHEEGGAAALDYASRAVRLFNEHIGPYPFSELDIVESPTLAGGIEYPGLVVINQSYYERDGISDRMEWVVVHEVLHQWWYSLVGNDQVDEPWLDEALVQYGTLLYHEDRYGAEVAERLRISIFEQAYEALQQSGGDQPVGLPVAHYSSADYGAVVYRKGPLYFHSLREQVGAESFWEILTTYFEYNRYGIARPDDWLAAVKAVTGSEYRSLFEDWIDDTRS